MDKVFDTTTAEERAVFAQRTKRALKALTEKLGADPGGVFVAAFLPDDADEPHTTVTNSSHPAMYMAAAHAILAAVPILPQCGSAACDAAAEAAPEVLDAFRKIYLED